MTLTVFLAVILAAALHAIWNALVKSGADKHLNMSGVVLGHAPLALIIIAFEPFPAAESWPYLIGGIILHFGYQVFLLTSYRFGDLTQVYPIARGSAPLIVAGISVMFLGVVLSTTEIFAVLIIGAGILSLGLVRQQGGGRNGKATALALCTGCFIASYSLVDGLGARVSGTVLGYYAWLGMANAVIFAIYIALTKPHVLPQLMTKGRTTFWIGGSASFIAYSLVIWAFTQAPIALVTALRETSIIFALGIGIVELYVLRNTPTSKIFCSEPSRAPPSSLCRVAARAARHKGRCRQQSPRQRTPTRQARC